MVLRMCLQLTVLDFNLPRLFSDKKVVHYLVFEGKPQRHAQGCLLVCVNPEDSLRRLSNWDYTALRHPVQNGLQSALLALQERGLLWDGHEMSESGRRRGKPPCFALRVVDAL